MACKRRLAAMLSKGKTQEDCRYGRDHRRCKCMPRTWGTAGQPERLFIAAALDARRSDGVRQRPSAPAHLGRVGVSGLYMPMRWMPRTHNTADKYLVLPCILLRLRHHYHHHHPRHIHPTRSYYSCPPLLPVMWPVRTRTKRRSTHFCACRMKSYWTSSKPASCLPGT